MWRARPDARTGCKRTTWTIPHLGRLDVLGHQHIEEIAAAAQATAGYGVIAVAAAGRERAVVVRSPGVQGNEYLMLIVSAPGDPGGVARSFDHGQQQSYQQRDDGNYDKQLDQSKSFFAIHRVHGGSHLL